MYERRKKKDDKNVPIFLTKFNLVSQFQVEFEQYPRISLFQISSRSYFRKLWFENCSYDFKAL